MSYDLDELDRMILNQLQANARTPFSKIAKEAGVSEATVFLRVRRLQQNGVIKAFRAIVSPPHVGRSLSAFILVKADPRKYGEVLNVVKNLNEVTEAYDVTGPYYLILRVDVADKESLAKVIDLIGSVDGVSSTETAIVLKEVKENVGLKV
ncbi:MAG: Lrp/AsnC family transcriptional regulator [Candidatus Methanomethylicia archaeon]|nr:Lrp/AsnC family transcriptional regulator [Candidatus Methanomethylicales archaeon]MCQ5362001.1 Lrp/AsnC family transcriptional regulator [Candidatus Methanomethylicia archaeon]MCQ5374286.1 Lrp/AsnC family transcriptional regulator [Candidatus Methanomethylicia archaeon]NHV60385.1 Lrp/AsnC family transcriptional regulator [Candidatus Verstraetearchaeota archaeon]